LSAGTPVISTDQFAIPEIVTHGKDGYLAHIDDPMLGRSVVPTKEDTLSVTQRNLDDKLAVSVYDALADVLEGRTDLNKYAAQAKKKFSAQGRFSIQTRNQQLRALYDNILK
jgi:glycosyltransferase involved in cell wall biosynthesis